MELVAAWVVFVLVAAVVSAGAGLLVDRCSGGGLPAELLLPLGLATLFGITQLTTKYDFTAELTIPLVAAVGAVGWVIGRGRARDVLPGRWPLAVALGVFAVFAAPVVLSGEATFAGYTVLGDTSIHMIGADQLLKSGRDLGNVPESSYRFALFVYYELSSYPAGGPAVAGSLSWLAGGQDVAWTFQPLLALMIALMSLALWSLLGPWVRPPALRAAIAFLGAQPALVLAYTLQGSIKETGTTFALVTMAALLPVYAREAPIGPRATIPMAVATAGGVGAVGLVFGLWAAPLALGALVAAALRHPALRFRPLIAAGAALGALVAVLCYQSLLQLTRYTESAGGVVTNQAEFGNLLMPLKLVQVLGIWITGDYRLPPPERLGVTYALIGVAVFGVLMAVRWVRDHRAWPLAVTFAVGVVVCAYILHRGSPWADGKALSITSPIALTAALLGAAALWEARRRFEGVALLALIAVGVLWSNALAYHDVSLAPRDRLAELQEIGERYAGDGPTLYTEFEEFGKHFLRDMQPEGSAEGWQPRFKEAGVGVQLGVMQDLDAFAQPYVTYYRTIVLRRGPFGSRPPAIYERVFAGRYYDVWQRSRPAAALRAHLGVGSGREPAGTPECERVREISELATQLAFVERPLGVQLAPATAERPASWYVDQTDGAVVHQVGQGVLRGTLTTPGEGDYGVWLEGSFGREVEVFIDGRRAGEVAGKLNGRRASELIGRVHLSAGSHDVELRRPGGSFWPGDGGRNRLLGSLTLTSVDPGGLEITTIPSTAWRSLCSKTVDWVAAVR